jgi:hydrogenase maturation protease
MSVVVGIGSPHGDDQLGWVAIDRLSAGLPEGVIARKARDGIELLEHLDGHDRAILIDAAAPAGRPGTVRSFVWPAVELAEYAPFCTHGLGLVDALRLAETLGRLPPRVTIHTVEAADTLPNAPLGECAAQAVDEVVAAVLCELERREG